jgi:hypothetical protein
MLSILSEAAAEAAASASDSTIREGNYISKEKRKSVDMLTKIYIFKIKYYFLRIR